MEGAGAYGEKVAMEVFNEEGFNYVMVCLKFLNGSSNTISDNVPLFSSNKGSLLLKIQK